MASGAVATGVVEQPLTDIPPDRLLTVEPGRVRLLNLDRPAAAPAAHPEKVLGYLPKLQQASGGAGAGLTALGRGSSSRACQYPGGRSSFGANPRTDGAFLPTVAAIFFPVLDRRHAPARGSVGHAALEHMKNIRVESAQSLNWELMPRLGAEPRHGPANGEAS